MQPLNLLQGGESAAAPDLNSEAENDLVSGDALVLVGTDLVSTAGKYAAAPIDLACSALMSIAFRNMNGWVGGKKKNGTRGNTPTMSQLRCAA